MQQGFRGGGGGGGRGFGRGRGGGRHGGRGDASAAAFTRVDGVSERPKYAICRFHMQGTCGRDDCKFSHDVSKLGTFEVGAPIKALVSAGTVVLGGTSTGALFAYDLSTGALSWSHEYRQPVTCIQSVAGLDVIALGTEGPAPLPGVAPGVVPTTVGCASVFFPKTGAELPLHVAPDRPFAHTHSVMALDFIPGPNVLLSGGAEGAVRIWEVGETARLVGACEGHVRDVTSILFANDRIWTASRDCTVRVWSPAGVCERILVPTPTGVPATPVTCMQRLTLDSITYIICGTEQGFVTIYNAADGTVASQFASMDSISMLVPVATAQGGPLLAVGHRNGSISFRDLQDSSTLLVHLTDVHRAPVTALVSPAPSQLVTGADDGSLQVLSF